MSEIGLNTILTSGAFASGAKNPEKIKDAAQQFEAMLIEQMLKSASASGSGDFTGSAGDETGAPLTDMAQQQFAQVLAANGGVGLAKMVVSGLEKGH